MVEDFIEENIQFMKKIALKSEIKYQHSAVLLYKNKIVSYGYNLCITKDKNLYNPVHAEISALYLVKKKYIKYLDILVIRVNSNLEIKNSKPCDNCMRKLKKKKIRRIFYSNENGKIVDAS